MTHEVCRIMKWQYRMTHCRSYKYRCFVLGTGMIYVALDYPLHGVS